MDYVVIIPNVVLPDLSTGETHIFFWGTISTVRLFAFKAPPFFTLSQTPTATPVRTFTARVHGLLCGENLIVYMERACIFNQSTPLFSLFISEEAEHCDGSAARP